MTARADATRRLPYRLRPAAAGRVSIGLLALSSDATIEAEWRRLLDGDGVEFYTGRVVCDAVVTPDSLRQTETRLTAAAAALLPDSPLDVLAYACTSATLMIGEAAVLGALGDARPGAALTTPLSAAKAALGALGARRIALLTPYLDEINRPLCADLQRAGLKIDAVGSFFQNSDPAVVRIDPRSIAAAAERLLDDGALPDALLIACTALRAAALIEPLERRFGIPVTTSNHALAWHALRLAGVAEPLPRHGRLFVEPLPATAEP